MSLGRRFAEALAAKDFDAVGELLHPEIDFRGMTPRQVWEAAGPAEIVDTILPRWLEEDDHVDELLAVEVDEFADIERVGYRFRVRNPDGEFVVEQQAYLTERDGRIGWLRILCSGFRPAG